MTGNVLRLPCADSGFYSCTLYILYHFVLVDSSFAHTPNIPQDSLCSVVCSSRKLEYRRHDCEIATDYMPCSLVSARCVVTVAF